MCASVEKKLCRVGKGDIDHTGRGGERAKARVKVSS